MTPEQIYNLRFRLQRSQREMAKIIETTETSFARWERGEAKPMPVYRARLEQLVKFVKDREKAEELGE